jgi:hypothetical protein
LLTGSIAVATGEAAFWEYYTNTDMVELNITLNMKWPQQRSSWLSMQVTVVLPTARQKFLQYFEGYLKLLRNFKILYLSIARFLVKTPMMLCRTVVVKHCSRWTHVASKQSTHADQPQTIYQQHFWKVQITHDAVAMYSNFEFSQNVRTHFYVNINIKS